jgi:hypothetical protein
MFPIPLISCSLAAGEVYCKQDFYEFFIHQSFFMFPLSLLFIWVRLYLDLWKENAIIPPMMKPISTERNTIIARDASNFQKIKEIATGAAF